MEEFDQLVSEQLETMDQLLFLQSEIERCQQVEVELAKLQHETTLASLREEITTMKKQLREIQQTFERQTEAIIQSYQKSAQLTP
ncbi:YgaB family protein [Metabacillus iocasae]|uniref:Nuclease with TOPRIM domain n=1 Tax=Priestia iocasae TaxID=2291674 RepID=A0ABS2QZ12_9BACI|nr:YgaB family protein [Metabacillus iocasae]MBM7704433.1 putative nuclease with TOPRIM domain [Metabacillus iocasae]